MIKKILFECTMISAILLLLFGLACARQEQNNKNLENDLLLLNLYGYWLATTGDCVHSSKMSINAGLLHCGRTSRSLCNTEGKIDGLGRLIVTSDKQNRYRSDMAAFVDQVPSCSTSLGSLLISPVFTETSAGSIDSINSNNHLASIDNCEDIGFSNQEKLLTKPEHNFIATPRGQLALQAIKIAATSCYTALAHNSSELQTLESLNSSQKLITTSCRYGTQASAALPTYSDCNSNEKQIANQFDFADF